jgi:hypothetical protein
MDTSSERLEEVLRELKRRAQRVGGSAGDVPESEDSLATEDDVARVEELIETNGWPHLRGR